MKHVNVFLYYGDIIRKHVYYGLFLALKDSDYEIREEARLIWGLLKASKP